MTSSGQIGHLQALLVEPSAMQAKIIRKVCDEIGLTQVQSVGSAADALAAMRAARPDVVLRGVETCGGLPSDFVPNHSFGYGRVDALRAVTW